MKNRILQKNKRFHKKLFDFIRAGDIIEKRKIHK